MTPITTETDGGYFTEATVGDYVVTTTKPGFTTVERIVTVRSEKNAVAADARLTPVSTVQNLIDSNGGKISSPVSVSSVTSVADNIELDVPAGALTEQVDIRLTPISNQGLANLLPLGWSPIAVVDIRSFDAEGTEIIEGTSFGTSASLKTPVLTSWNFVPSSSISVVRYDTTSHQWVVRNPGAVSADKTSITTSISSTGQYAFVLPDQQLAAAPAVGQPLPSASSTSEGVTATGRVVPPAAPPSAGLKAVGEVVLTPSPSAGEGGGEGGLTSGLIITARVTERFDLFSGEVVLPSEYIQDLVLYHHPCITNSGWSAVSSVANGSVLTTFPVTPSKEYTITELMLGKVGIEISLPAVEEKGVMVGAGGARLLDADGNVLVIPEGALNQTVPVSTKTISASMFTSVIGGDFTLLRAVEVNLTGRTLSTSSELSIPAPSGFNASLPIVVAKLIEVKGAGWLKLVALARISGSLVISSALSADSAVNFPGIVSSGVYLFLQAKAPLGFITGTVKDGSGNPYSSAIVTSSTCSLVDLTAADGRYLIPGAVSAFTATAADIYKNDAGAATGAVISANQVVTTNLTIQVTPPRIVSITPADNATGVEPNASIVITFSEPVDKTTITSANIILKDANNITLPGVFSVNPEGTVVTLYPSDLLKSEARHTLFISKSIRDLQGYLMGSGVTSSFTVKDTTPPPLPPAGSVTGTLPDADGYVTITATQGSAETTGIILIINENSGEIVSVTPESNGSFTGRIMAMLGDDIKVMLMDQAGNKTMISYITFKSEDGRYLVTAKGGIVDGEGGSQLIVPEGALSGPAVIKLMRFAEDELPHPLPEKIAFLAGVKIDAGGATFQKPVKLSVPAPSNISDMPEGSMPFVAEPQVLKNADGTEEKVFVVHDSAKIIDTPDGKRVTTASPPFDGIGVGGYYIFIFPYMTVAIVDGYTYKDVDGLGGYQPAMLSDGTYDKTHDLPVKNAVIRSPGATSVLSYSNSRGAYAIFAEVIYNSSLGDLCMRNSYLTAIHPLTMKRVEINAPLCEPPYNIIHDLNIRLADAATTLPDTTAPAIGINLQVAAQQDAGNENARFTAGTIPVNTNITVPLSVTDQEMGTTTLTVTYKTPDMTAGVQYSVMATPPSTPELYIPANADSPAVYKYVYTQSYPSPINGCGSLCFRPDKPGTYTFSVEARDAAGNKSTRSVQVRAVLSGTPPKGIDGPPQVDEIVPTDGAKKIMITMPVMVTFSEPVLNVNEDTFQLFVYDYDPNTQQTYANPVPAGVYTSIEGGRMRAALQPKNNLMYGKTYKIVLTTGITDSVPNPSYNDALLHLDHQYEATFTTKVPQIYDLESGILGFSYGDIALYTEPNTGRSFAYITANEKGWHAVDVTDPTRPFVAYSQNMSTQAVIWRYRGAAVDPQSGILALTEWIQWLWEGGSQYGYVRFYDIRTNPAQPSKIGQEQLAEAASGVPDKVVIAGNYAFITTLMVGLQVVDIDASKISYRTNVGESIVGWLRTVDLDACPRPDNPALNLCGSPSDLALIRNNLALIPTFSGYLLVVDVSSPQNPALITAFRPDGYSARRIAATSEYAYTDESGDNMVIDLAVTSTSGSQGSIHTVDVTEPYNPRVLGVVKDSSGNVVNNILATDITISKQSGLVYVTAGMSVYVIDIRDPRYPVLLNVITQAPNADGNMMPLGYSPAVAEKDGWVYLVNQQKGLRVLDLDPVEIGIVDTDPEFTDVVLPGRDYYPALGTKAVTVWGMVSGDPLDDKWELHVNESVANFKIGGKLNTDGKPENSSPAAFKTAPGYREGFATLYIAWDGGSATPWPDNITIRLQAVKKNATLPLMISVNASEQYSYVFTMRHNGNVKLQEVLGGKAVFIADGVPSISENDKKRFDYVKELLNQVVPRKRTLKFDGLGLPEHLALNPENEKNYPYHAENTGAPFLDEQNTRFDPGRHAQNISDNARRTAQALQIFRKNFELPNTSLATQSETFRKLMKDYNKTTDAEKFMWLSQIVDKETLVGGRLNEGTTPDRAIGAETGLYELYYNVVKKFMDAMIKEAERYAGIRHAPVEELPAADWIARTGEGPATRNNPGHSEGMSYTFGGKQTVEEYNKESGGGVARNCRIAPSETEKQIVISTSGIEARKCNACHYLGAGTNDKKFRYQTFVKIPAVGDNYKGNVKSNACGIDGDQKYPGLYQYEWNMHKNSHTVYDFSTGTMSGQTPIYPQFDPTYWAGADCSNLVQKSILKAKAEFSGAGSPTLPVSELPHLWTQSFLADKIAYQAPLSATSKMQKWLRKGDLIHYDGHISIVHRERPTCSGSDARTTCTYEIIHAYGRDSVDLGTRDNPLPVFTRKVRVNSNNEPRMPSPTGFGRIKLWD